MGGKTSAQYQAVSAAAHLAPSSGAFPHFEQVYRSEFPHVWRFLYRMGCRGQVVEDLTHDVFLMALRRSDSFDGSRPVRPWLLGIAYRVASDFRALVRHEREVGGMEERAEQHLDEAPGPEQMLEAREAKDLVTAALAALPLEQRATFVLHELEHRTIPEVAELMGVPVPTAYTRLRAARQRFTAAIESLSPKRGVRDE